MDLELDSIYEELVNYHINDYAIFEATLKRDFLEATGLLTEEADKNIFQKIGAGIKKILKIIIDKLKALVEKIKETATKIKTDVLIKKYKKYYDAENGELEEFFVPWYSLYIGEGRIDISELLSFEKSSNEIQREIDKLKDIVDYPAMIDRKIRNSIEKEDLDNLAKYPFKKYKDLKRKLPEFIDQLSKLTKYRIEKCIDNIIKYVEKEYKMIDTAQVVLGQAESVLYLQYLNLYKTYLIRSTSSYYSWNLRAFRHNCDLYKTAGEYLKKKLEK